MQTVTKKVNAALDALKQGKMIILTDSPNRENEGDLIALAENVSAETINFMIRQGTGIVCISLPEEKLKQLNLPFMVRPEENSSSAGTPFTISVDAALGITTGVSAADRALTINVMMQDHAKPSDLTKPGHIFPLQARAGGVLERQGHTEGALDLAILAGSKAGGVLCEIMNADGSMAQGQDLIDFANKHQLISISIDELIEYRLLHENLIADQTQASLPTAEYGAFKLQVVKEKFTGNEHMVLLHEKTDLSQPLLVRIHSCCATGDLFSSLRCDCHQQLHYALKQISEQGGMLIYLNQEGRGIGLFNKIKAYALQEQGLDTVEANEKLGLPVDDRKYHVAANILRQYHVKHVKLLTNNPEKINALKQCGISTVERANLPVFNNEHNKFYLQTKKEKLKHNIDVNRE